MPEQVKNQEIADTILSDEKYADNLLYCTSHDLFYLYQDGIYVAYQPEATAATVYSYLISGFPEKNITKQIVMDIVAQMKWACKRKVETMVSPYIAFTDQLYNCETFAYEPFDRNRVCIFRLPFASIELSDPCPRWHRFLNEVLVFDGTTKPDPELTTVMQEIFGFYLLPDLKAHKVFFLVGGGANGKSVLLNVLESMLGDDQVSAMSVQTLTTNHFATSALIGKKLNVCNEEESKYMRSDRFKALISGDRIDGERKYGDRFSFRPTTKYIFATNEMPTFDGLNMGLRRRIVIVPFHRTLQDHEQNRNLTQELLTELPGIVAWALAGARKLVEQKYLFSEAKAIRTSATEFESAISSPLMYFREEWQVDIFNEQWVATTDLYQKYANWCIAVGKKSMSRISFLRELQRTLGLKVTNPRRLPDGQHSRGLFVKPIDISIEEEETPSENPRDIWQELQDAAKS
jgi:putative DNA primase/helicase